MKTKNIYYLIGFALATSLACACSTAEADRAAAPFQKLGGTVRYSADGASRYSGASGIRGLDMRGSSMTDDDLENLIDLMKTMDNLAYLYLQGTKISDRGIAKLSQVKQLKSLNVIETMVTKEGVARLKRALPTIKVNGPGSSDL